jgi:hypothetical protein
MIPSNELRIGNYVLAGQTVQCISMIDGASSTTTVVLLESTEGKTKSGTSYRLESLQPVPLNDGLLQQCRFVYHNYFKFWQLVDGQEENRSEMDIDRDYNILDFMRKPIVKKVASLHQLQNIYFMLKGKELVVRDPA